VSSIKDTCHYNIKHNASIPLKYNYFSTQSPSTLVHLSDIGLSLKTSSS